MIKKIALILLIFTLAISGCARKSEAPASWDQDSYMTTALEPESAAPLDREASGLSYSKSASFEAAEPQTQERLIVRNAQLSIQVLDAKQAIDAISAFAVQFGGFVVSSTTYNRDYYLIDDVRQPLLSGDIVIRVNVSDFETAIRMIEELTPDVTKNVSNKTITGKDITSDYVDSNSRLAALEVTRDKLNEILDTAKTAEETLLIYREITDVDSQIEVLKGQIKYMKDSAVLSSISIHLETIRPSGITVKPWTLGETVTDALQNLLETGRDLVDILIYFVISVLPFLLLFGIPLFLILRWLIRKIAKAIRAMNAPQKD